MKVISVKNPREFWDTWIGQWRGNDSDLPFAFAEAFAKEQLAPVIPLLERAAEFCSDNPPDKDWFRDYFLFTGDHMILTDEGWEPGNLIEQIRKDNDDPEWEPDDEINAPL